MDNLPTTGQDDNAASHCEEFAEFNEHIVVSWGVNMEYGRNINGIVGIPWKMWANETSGILFSNLPQWLALCWPRCGNFPRFQLDHKFFMGYVPNFSWSCPLGLKALCFSPTTLAFEFLNDCPDALSECSVPKRSKYQGFGRLPNAFGLIGNDFGRDSLLLSVPLLCVSCDISVLSLVEHQLLTLAPWLCSCWPAEWAAPGRDSILPHQCPEGWRAHQAESDRPDGWNSTLDTAAKIVMWTRSKKWNKISNKLVASKNWRIALLTNNKLLS